MSEKWICLDCKKEMTYYLKEFHEVKECKFLQGKVKPMNEKELKQLMKHSSENAFKQGKR